MKLSSFFLVGTNPDEFLTRTKLEADWRFTLCLFLFVARFRFNDNNETIYITLTEYMIDLKQVNKTLIVTFSKTHNEEEMERLDTFFYLVFMILDHYINPFIVYQNENEILTYLYMSR